MTISLLHLGLSLSFVFLVIKNYYVCKEGTGISKFPILFFVTLVIAVAGVPLTALSIIIFWLYRKLASLLLTLRHGSKFWGLLEGIDATHTTTSARKAPVHYLFILEHAGEQPFLHFFRETLREITTKRLKRNAKIFARFEEFLGYPYLVKNGVAFDECVRAMKTVEKETLEKSDVMKLLGEYSHTPLPKNFKGLWEVIVGTQPIRWGGNGNLYPVIFRFNHCMTDGMAFLKTLLRVFADRENPERIEPLSPTPTREVLREKLRIVGKTFKAICLSPSAILMQMWFKRNDPNVLYGPELTNRKVISFVVEDNPTYIEKVKRIKKKVPGSTFTDVFLTAITASLDEYFEKRSVVAPNHVAAVMAAEPDAGKDFHTAYNVENACQNKSSLFVSQLPIRIQHVDKDRVLLERLRLIQKQGALSRNPVNHEVNYWLLRAFGTVFTRHIGDALVRLNNCTMGISNLPGIPQIRVNGSTVHDIVCWLANRERTGIAFSILTYGGRLQMGLLIDKALIPEQQEVDQILRGVFKYLDMLDEK